MNPLNTTPFQIPKTVSNKISVIFYLKASSMICMETFENSFVSDTFITYMIQLNKIVYFSSNSRLCFHGYMYV